MSAKVVPKNRKVPGTALFNIQGMVLCLVRLHLRTLSILIRLRFGKVPLITLFNRILRGWRHPLYVKEGYTLRYLRRIRTVRVLR